MKTTLSPPQRQDYLDALRLLATCAVLALHATSKQWYRVPVTESDWQILNIYDSLVRFCVPLFFMISGALFLDPHRPCPKKKLFTKYIPRLLLIFLVWSSIYALADIKRQEIPFSPSYFLTRVAAGHYHLWFLLALLGLYLMIPLLRPLSADRSTLEYFLILSFFFVQVVSVLELWEVSGKWLEIWQERAEIHLVLGYSGYFMLGTYLHRFPLGPTPRRLSYLAALLSLAATIYGTYYLSLRDGQANSALYSYLLPTTYSVSFALFSLFQQLKFPYFVQKLIQFLCPLSLGIYLVHDLFLVLFLEDFNWLGLNLSTLWTVPLFTLAVFFSSFLVTFFLSVLPFIRKII